MYSEIKFKIQILNIVQNLIKKIIILLLILSVQVSNSFAGQAEDNSVTALNTAAFQEPDDNRKKELTYIVLQDCGSCHGMTLKGGLGPSLEAKRLAVLPKQYLMDAVIHGRKDTPMPPWGPLLTQGEIQWIVEQLQSGQLGRHSQ
ncbi:MAG: cytochrome c [gamma proteobacterium symbiont of Taylorina sp.]|nr:cytochrome c [gamma proteobacterium symbiont of Taylorina sp.]